MPRIGFPAVSLRATLPRVVRDLDIAALTGFAVIGMGLQLDGGAVEQGGLLLLAVAISAYRPAAAVAAIPAAAPWVAMPVLVGSASFSLLELAIVVAGAGVGLRVVWELAQARSLRPLIGLARPYDVSAAAAVLLAAGMLSLTTVVDMRFRPESLRAFRWTIVEPLVALVLFRWALRRGARPLLAGAFVAASVAAAAAGLVQLAVGRGVVIADGVERATGPYTHPNNLAFLLSRALMIGLALAIAGGAAGRWRWLAACVLGAGLLATLSRGGLAGAAIGGVWVLGASPWRRHWRRALPVAVALLALLAVFAGARLRDTGGTGTVSSRELIWRASVTMLRDHPWTGVGLDQFLHQYNSRYVAPAGWGERYTSHPHNLVLDVWLSLGVAGLIAAALVAGVVVRRVVGGRSRWDPVFVGASAALLAGVVHGMVDNGYFLPDLAVLTWFFIALIEAGPDPARLEESRD